MPRKSAVAPETKPAARAQRIAAKPTAKPAAKPTAKSAARKPAAAKKGGVKTAVKVAAKALASPAPAKPARKATAKSVARPPVVERSAPDQARPVLVRDSFTMPEQEYAVLLEVKQACLRAGIDVKKSELLRIGVALLGQLDVATLQGVLAALPQLKTGRPPAA